MVFMIIAVANWQGNVSPVFDVSDRLCVVEIDGGTEVRRETVALKCRDPFGRAREVAGTGVEVLICGAVSHVFETALISVGIRVLPFICGDLETVIGAFLQGRLTDGGFLMPGCFGRRQGRRFQHRRGRGLKGR
ncbi:MAG TPA: dinitrogenase iron-molybdenum cofactor biosynthesis protein [Deltaproteobacteria bacterium]|nr:dinitrogenase iron-molybdenum cofactor biosynthesis protein [Deltaproteobacteria bacterium]